MAALSYGSSVAWTSAILSPHPIRHEGTVTGFSHYGSRVSIRGNDGIHYSVPRESVRLVSC